MGWHVRPAGRCTPPRGLCNGLSECFCLDYRQVLFRGGGGGCYACACACSCIADFPQAAILRTGVPV